MGVILDDITVFKDAITGSAFESLAAADGESLSIRWLGVGTRVELLEAWGGNNASKCDFSIRSPLLHDNQRGVRWAHMFNPTTSGADGNPQRYLPPSFKQDLNPTDTLVAEVLGTASDDVTLSLCLKYDTPNMPGGRFATVGDVDARIKNLLGNRVSPAPAASTSTYGAAESIAADDDRFKANTDYALLGFTTDLPFTTLGVFGPDTGNFTIPMPGIWDESQTSGWFYELARRFNDALIPVINSNNKGVTFVKAATAGGGTAPLISLLWAELG